MGSEMCIRDSAGGYRVGTERCDVAELVDDAVEALTPTADKGRVALVRDLDGAAPVRGSAADLGRAIRNLLDNAIRHAGADGEVRVAVSRSADHVAVEVSDSGPGFPENFTAEALKPFTRADASRSRAGGGAGLGLAITAGVVAAHRGETSVTAGPGGHIRVELPAA